MTTFSLYLNRMKSIRAVFIFSKIIIFSIVYSQSSFSQDGFTVLSYEQSFGLISSVYLELHDEARDKCFTNSTAVKNKVRLIFEQNNIPVYSEPAFFPSIIHPTLRMVISGERVSGGFCYGQMAASLQLTLADNYGKFIPLGDTGGVLREYNWHLPVSFFEQSTSLVNSDSFNKQASDFFEAYVNGLVANILFAKREEVVKIFFEKLPDTKVRYTQSDYEKLNVNKKAE